MNYVQLVGYVVKGTEILNNKLPQKYSKFSLKVSSNFRDHDGSYREDVYEVYLWQGGHASLVDILKEGDIISCKGRLEKHDDTIVVVAESYERLMPGNSQS